MATLEQRPFPIAVRLRPAAARDAALLWRWRGEWSVRRFQPLHDLSSAQLRSDLSSQRPADLYRGVGEKYQWVIEAGEEPVGWITLVVTNWEHGLAEVGYALAGAHQGRGIMSRALSLLLQDLFSRTRLERIEARCMPDNHSSRRVLEKNGFRREGRLRSYFALRGRRVDNLLYAILRSDPRPVV